MFSEKIESWKTIAAGFGIFGFVLSLITGIFGRVSFGVLIFRAFLFAAGFAAVSLGIMKIVEKFIPELLDETSDDSSENSETSVIIDGEDNSESISGKNLDITIEDENEGRKDKDAIFDEFDASESGQVKKGQYKDSDEAEDVEELDDAEALDDEDNSDEPVVIQSAPAAKNGRNGTGQGKKSGNGKAGDLPDISVFSDSFVQEEAEEAEDGLNSIDGLGEAGGAEILGSRHDTQEMAKAVQTILKKDQEG